ncbi:HdeA/HdeB family chaperone [uncultured Enterovirga sp.]|uniref:HdeA/HdeB family chaperone n=1 Tax=uncultured Enterovirga sp. TaxID=2026352 RepID=UPI0035CC7885
MRLSPVLALVIGLAATGSALAEKLDLRTVQCGDFIKQDKDFHGQILMWLSAYSMKEDDDPIIDFDRVVATGKNLGRYCAENPTSALLTAFESASK